MSAATLSTTNIAFKEWAVVCDQLLSGDQVVLLRKGGILEQKAGREFQIEHDTFLLYPNTEHQSKEQLKPEFHAKSETYGPPPKVSGQIKIAGYCKVVDIVKTSDEAKLRGLEAVTCWAQPLFDMRINYKKEKPNFAVTVRAYKLPEPIVVPYHTDYAGCHSWVPLKDELQLNGTPVLDDATFEAKRREALKIVQ